MPDTPIVPGVRTPEHPVPPTESAPLPEAGVERTPIQEAAPSVATPESAVGPVPVTPIAVTPVVPSATIRHQVEAVMTDGLESTYQKLDSATQAKLKQAGEETAGKISILLESSKIQVKKILELLVTWLRIIPGINLFFLEQEAKIKTDRLLRLRQTGSEPTKVP